MEKLTDLTNAAVTDEMQTASEKITYEDLQKKENRLEPGQLTVLQLLKELDEICRRNNITYYASGGTALGALRHNGFIPWDDDADVHLTRDNFHKLINLPESEFPPNRKIICWEKDPDYNFSSARYIDSSTTVLYKHNTTRDYPSGVMVDLVVLEPMPADPAKWQKHMDLLQVWHDYRCPEVVSSHRWWGNAYYHRYEILDKLMGRKRFLKYIEKRLFCEPDDENTTAYHQRWASVPWIFSKEYFKEPERLPFEDMMLAVPTDVEAFLTQSYTDDWMYIPAPDYRDHHESIESTEFPSEVFMRDYQPFLKDRKKMFRNYKKRTNNFINNKDFRANFLKGNFYFHTKQIEYDCRNRLNEDGRPLEQIVAEKDYAALEKILTQYLPVQYGAACIGGRSYGAWYRRNNPILLDLSDEIHYAGLILALHKGQIYKADRVLLARAEKEDLPEKFAELRGFIDDLRGAVDAYFCKDYENAGAVAKIWLEKFPDNLSWIRLAVAIDFETNKEEAQQRELLERVKAALKEYPSDDVLRYIAMKLLTSSWKQTDGDSIEAVITKVIPAEEAGGEDQTIEETLTASEYAEYLLDSLYANCSNGFVLMALRKSLEKAAEEAPDDEELLKKLRKVHERMGVRFKNIEFPGACSEDEEEQTEEIEDKDDIFRELISKFPENTETFEKLKKLLEQTGLHIRDFEFDPNDPDEESNEADDSGEDAKQILIDEESPEDENGETSEEDEGYSKESLRSFKEVCLTMLMEIDKICVKHGIPYYLTGSAAVAAGKNIEELPESFSRPRIAMYVEDFLRFKAAFAAEKLSERKLDCMLDNPDFPNFGARYTDETTLHYPIKMHKYYASRGIAVEIDFIRSKNNSRKAKAVYALEHAWEYMHIKANGYRKAVPILAGLLRAVSVLGGKKCLAKKIFKLCTKASVLGKSQKCFIRSIDAKVKLKNYSCSVFGMPQRLLVDGEELSFPSMLKGYLSAWNSGWRRTAVAGTGANRYNIKDANKPYAEYEALLNPKTVSRQWRETSKLNAIDVEKDRLTEILMDYWYIMLRSEARIKLWQKYKPLKAEILELSAEADARTDKVKQAEKKNAAEEVMEELLEQQAEIYGQLEEILKDYSQEIKRFAKRKMGLCFDKDIMNVMVKVMRYQGKNRAADKLLSTTPKATYKAPDLSF